MRSKHQGIRGYATIAALALAAATAGTVSAAADPVPPAPTPIGPHQAFTGQVNAVSAGAVIKVGCFGPVTPNETGHPVAGQSVSVALLPQPSPVSAGYTGDAATHVVVEFGVPVSAGPITQLSAYGLPVAIPAWLDLPCSGVGKVVFAPVPTSANARSSTIPVTYQNVGL